MNVLINYSNAVKVLFDLNKNKMPVHIKDYFENIFNIINSEYVGGILSDETITLIDEFDYVFKYSGLGDICLTELLSHLQLNVKKHKYVEHKTTRGTVKRMCKHCGYIKEDNSYRKKIKFKLR